MTKLCVDGELIYLATLLISSINQAKIILLQTRFLVLFVRLRLLILYIKYMMRYVTQVLYVYRILLRSKTYPTLLMI